ncbi:MAG: hypothetical protein GYA62_00345 [Bacteroidales bacterium]|nr:hypothetical protein [Bacteroidales bacterium]
MKKNLFALITILFVLIFNTNLKAVEPSVEELNSIAKGFVENYGKLSSSGSKEIIIFYYEASYYYNQVIIIRDLINLRNSLVCNKDINTANTLINNKIKHLKNARGKESRNATSQLLNEQLNEVKTKELIPICKELIILLNNWDKFIENM